MDILNICSYNCRGLPKDKHKLAIRPDISTILDSNHIIAFQETWYSKQNLHILNSIHPLFEGIGAAKIDESCNILQGRYSGGVAILWRKELGSVTEYSTLRAVLMPASNKKYNLDVVFIAIL